jgi:hypothetical protein
MFQRSGYQNNAYQGDGIPVAIAVPVSSGGRVRKKKSYAVEIEGQYRFFNSWEDLEEFLASLQERELEEAQASVEKVVQRIISTGKAPQRAPRIRVQQASLEVREHVDLLNLEIERIYWRKVSEEIAARSDEEDIAILLGAI